MTRVSDEKALWLAKNVLPHEPELRSWLANRRLDGLEIDDIVQETYARLIASSNIDGIRNPRTYPFSTAYSVILTHVRRARIVSFEAVADLDELGVVADRYKRRAVCKLCGAREPLVAVGVSTISSVAHMVDV